MRQHLFRFVFTAAASSVLLACGGGGGTASITPDSPSTPSLSGVAAVGAPLTGAAITLTDSKGAQKTTTADDNGNFKFNDLTGMTGPFQIMAVMNLGERTVSHYSLVASVSGAQTANVTQLTSAFAALLNSSGVLSSLTPEQLAALTPDQINQAKQKILTTIQPLTSKIVTGTFDPVSTPFAANGTGADLLLDHLDLTVRANQISLTNKMAALGDSTDATSATGVIPKSGNPTPISDDSTTSTSGFEVLQKAFETCFKLSAAQRAVVTNASTATLAAECDALATADYLHNGQNIKMRWIKAFKFDKFNANTPTSADVKQTKFLRPEVRLRISSSPEIIAVNIHFNDTDGNSYTTPELIKKMPDGSWKLYGNQRGMNAFVESQLNYYQDLSKAPANSNYNNINFSRIDSGFRFYVDPRTAFDANGTPDNSLAVDYTTLTGYKSGTAAYFSAIKAAANVSPTRPFFKCAVITGPGRMVNSKWMGIYPDGLVLKVPLSSAVQDYVAIDRRLSSAEKAALETAASMGTAYSSRPAISGGFNICGSNTTGLSYPTTTTSASNYTVEVEALTNQTHPFTGQTDAGINGRDVKWNTGARFARVAPDTSLAKEFDSNPVFTYYIIDTNNKVAQKYTTRMLGELPPVSQAREIMEKKLSSQMDVNVLKNYLDFQGSGATNNTTSVSAKWTTEANAFGADLIGFYSEIQKAKPGEGLRSKFAADPQSRVTTSRDNGSGNVVYGTTTNGVFTYGETTLWESDPDLAVDLDALPGVNFWWRWSVFARSKTISATVCNPQGSNAGSNAPSTNALVTSQNVGVARSTKEFNGTTLAKTYYGVDQLNSSDTCLDWGNGAGTNAYLHREVWLRTYTDKNVRFYSYTANKSFR